MTIIRNDWERLTGGADTSLGNFIVISHVFAEAIRMHGLKFEAAGFVLKARLAEGPLSGLGETWYPGTFLKGTWWRSDEGSWHWGPLLSRALKIFKLIVRANPVLDTYRLPGEGRNTYQQCAERHCAATALAFRQFTLPPGLSDWVAGQLARPLPVLPSQVRLEELQGYWKVKSSEGHSVARDTAIHQIAAWYGVAAELVDDFCHHLASLRPGQFSTHPLWLVLSERDYG